MTREDVIRHEHGKWVLYTHDGSRKLGEHDTKEGAMAQERAVQAAKHARVRRYDAGELNKPVRLDNGYLVADARITRVGVFDYRNADGTVRRELRTPDEVFHADAMDSFRMVPLTNEHPTELLNATNTRKYQVGSVSEVKRDGEFVGGRLLVTDADAIAAAEKGRRELSCGYHCDLEMGAGTTKGIDGVQDGLRYDAVQRNIRGNHVALVDRGRAGTEVSMRLDADDAFMISINGSAESLAPKETRMKLLKIDGVDFEVSEQAEQAFTKALAKSDADGAATLAELQTARENLTKQTARADKAEEELAAAKKIHADAVAPDAVAKVVRGRVELVRTAEKILGADHGLKLDEMGDADLKKAVVLKLSPEAKAKLDAGDATYLAARFDAAVEGFKPAEPNAGLAAVRGATGTPAERKDATSSREKMLQDNLKIGREPMKRKAV